jgi:hypothetical protein
MELDWDRGVLTIVDRDRPDLPGEALCFSCLTAYFIALEPHGTETTN